MDSLTKNILSHEDIKKMAEKAFSEEKQVKNITELKQGYFNAAYIVEFFDGMEAVLKIAPKDTVQILSYEKDIMRAEVEALEIIKAHTNVPVPEVHFYDNSKTLCDSEYFFMEKIDGSNYSDVMGFMDLEQKETIEIELGAYNREINQIKGSIFGYLVQPEKQSGNWGEAFYNIVTDILNDGIAMDIQLPLPYDAIHAVIKKYLYACNSVKEPRLIHWDLWPGNVIIKKGRIAGIIDLERALWADPLMEFYFKEETDSKYFCIGYNEDLICGDEAKIRRLLYNIYLYLVMKIECKYRGYEDSGQNEWAGNMIIDEINKLKEFEPILSE